MRSQRYRLVLAGLLIMALALVAPAGAVHVRPAIPDLLPTAAFDPAPLPAGITNISFNTMSARDIAVVRQFGIPVTDSVVTADSIVPSQSLQDAIDAALPGDTIVLEPGIYREHNLTIAKDLFIVANVSAGGDRNNTIIDAQGADRIFNITGPNQVWLENLTLRNGRVSGNGGAIHTDGALIILISTSISNCSADGDGGAIYSLPSGSSFGTIFMVSSSISRCSSGSAGGAIASVGANVLILDSTVSFCSAPGGGAIAVNGAQVLLLSAWVDSCSALFGGGIYEQGGGVFAQESAFRNCSASLWGGGIFSAGTTTQILGTSFTDCSAGLWGGAVESFGTLVGDDNEFTRCRATDGGALDFYENVTVISRSNFTDCTASNDGGAVWALHGEVITASSQFTRCHAENHGGALALWGPGDTNAIIISSDFTGCSSGTGGAVFTGIPVEMHYSRVYGCDEGTAFWNENSTIAANVQDTWWGTNAEPVGSVHGNVSYSPWLVLGITSPRTIWTGSAAAVRTNLTWDSAGANTSVSGSFVPDGILTMYSVSGSGTVNPMTALTVEGVAGTFYTGGAIGTNTVCGTVDGQTVCTPVEVSYPPSPMGPSNDDDALPSSVTPSVTGSAATLIPMTVTVNIAGNSAAGRATVTGTKLAGLVVTGTVLQGPGTNRTSPTGIVYQFIDLEPAGYTGISHAVINFTVPQSWLEENRVASGSVVLYHQTPDGWEALPSTVLQARDGQVFFSAQSPGLSLFAIAGTPSGPAPGTSPAVVADTAGPAKDPEPVKTGNSQVPVATETTAVPPGAEAPASTTGLPVMLALLGVCALGLLGGGFFARRWWIRRQNPALFRESE